MSATLIRTADTQCSYPDCSKTVWQDPDGSYSAYCSRSHLEKAQFTAGELCKNCQTRPVYVENGRSHDFCGVRCATAYRNGTQIRRDAPAQSTESQCKLVECKRPVYVDDDGVPGEYCSESHRLKAVRAGAAEACLFCGLAPKARINDRYSDFCSRRCKEDAVDSAPIILQLQKSHDAYIEVEEQFKDTWKHSTNVPVVHQIWKIYGSKNANDTFDRYRLSLERRTGKKDGNTQRRWHGTIRACTLGDSELLRELCTSETCSLCNIIRSSFQLARAGERTNFGRFGAGIYTSGTSSKANNYVAETGGSSYKSVLLNEVIMGEGIKLHTGDETLTEPPPGYDSVIGEPGGDLNYDESIVYTNDAIRPIFLILYQE
ncbi:hypothetical protein SCP_1104130 [Sparassis crispa]|uniref:PARP catalytic domain-containing protein n=1 Tax=Sparassis crispa TaxID=139825 RepID=A0A401GZY2_9APHY|nr:hypothetical protein SCP_1104130 [Sparassis crispa]GBE87736.1 hypothetical protein SCP_1104130 [Sparassis crispa]